MNVELGRAWDLVLALGAVFVVITGAMAIAPALIAAFKRTTIGRRRDHYRRLSRLGTNAQLSFFEAVLGQPPALRRRFVAPVTTLADGTADTSLSNTYATRIALFARELAASGAFDELRDAAGNDDVIAPAGDTRSGQWELVQVPLPLEEVIWVDHDYYVQAIADPDETVLAYAVTTRSRRFRPEYEVPIDTPAKRFWPFARRNSIFRVQLLRSRFAEHGEPRAIYSYLGMRRFTYAEAHWHGNPGSYQHYVSSFNDAGAGSWPDVRLIFPDGVGVFRFGAWSAAIASSLNSVDLFRDRSVSNTYAVVGPRFHIEDIPVGFGPDLDEVRTLY